MFAGINVAVFGTKSYHVLRDITFAVSSGLANYLDTHELCLREFIFAT